MVDGLSEGKAPCDARGCVMVRLTADCVAMGESVAAIRAVFAAVHRANRTSGGARAMLDAPEYDPTRQGLSRIGGQLALFGPPAHLAAVLADPTVARLARTGALEVGAVEPAAPPAHALKRIRRGERSTPAGLARAQRRAERRGTGWEPRPHRGAGLRQPAEGTAFVSLAPGRKIELARVAAPAELLVSTYGTV